MKNILISGIVWIILLSSCISTKVSSVNNYDYSTLKTEHNYIVKTKDGNVIRKFEFREETDDYILGLYQNKEMKIDKNNIRKINKFSVAKTIPVGILGATAVVIFIYMQNKTLGDYYH